LIAAYFFVEQKLLSQFTHWEALLWSSTFSFSFEINPLGPGNENEKQVKSETFGIAKSANRKRSNVEKINHSKSFNSVSPLLSKPNQIKREKTISNLNILVYSKASNTSGISDK